MRTAILGPGAMGSLFGAFLARAGHPVTLLDHRPERAADLARSGLQVEGAGERFRVRVPVVHRPAAAGTADLLLVCVKSRDTGSAVRRFRAVVGDRTVVCSFQNGLGHLELLQELVGARKVLGGTTTTGAHLSGPGQVHLAGWGQTLVGEPAGGRSARARELAAVLSAAGWPTRAVADLPRRLWAKLAVNAGINALTALLRVRNGALLGDAAARRLMEEAAGEVAEVGRALGLRISRSGVVAAVRATARRTAANRSSMLTDALAGRPSEVDAIQGAVVRYGREAGVATPVNTLLLALMGALDRTGHLREG